MSGFRINQKVVCVDPSTGSNWLYNPLTRDGVYRIDSIYTCACGQVALNIGIQSYSGGTTCGCGAVTNDGVWVFRASRFRPIDSLTEQMDRIEEEGAPVELEPEYA